MSYFLTIPNDYNYEQRSEWKKRVMDNRGRKIFNPKLAKQAYDVADIKAQISEKKTNERAEAMRNLTFDQAARRLDTVHHAIQAQQEEVKRNTRQQVDQYRKLFQRKEDSMTYDLNDPNFLKKDPKIGENGDYSIYGPSSILTFESDVIRTPLLLKNSVTRQKEYLDEQMHQLKIRKDKERHIENAHAKEFNSQQAVVEAIDHAAAELQKATAMATDHYNKHLATTQEDLKRRKKEMDEADKKAHINNTINGNFLNEVSYYPRDWRGLSQEQIQKLYEERSQQVKDKQTAKNQEKEENSTWDNYFRSVENEARSQLTALQEERMAIRKKIDDLNKHTFDVTENEQKELDRISKNGANPTEEWFDTFQRDPR